MNLSSSYPVESTEKLLLANLSKLIKQLQSLLRKIQVVATNHVLPLVTYS